MNFSVEMLREPALWIYVTMAVIFLLGVWLCIRPMMQVGRALKRAEKKIGSRRTDGSHIYDIPNFLNCKWLNHSWACFLANLDAMKKSNGSCSVSDYINPRTAIQEPGHGAFGGMIPGVLTTLGILGSFYGIVQGLSMLDLTSSETMGASIAVLIGGMRTAFNTSIVGAVLALVFQLWRRLVSELTGRSLSRFVQTCDSQICASLSGEAAMSRTMHAILTELRAIRDEMKANRG